MALDQKTGTNSISGRMIALLEPKLNELGYELLQLDFLAKGPLGDALVRIYIDQLDDSDSKGIVHEDCMRVDRELDPIFEGEAFNQIFQKEFTLEVSSPGVDRPLRKKAHFERFVGRWAKVKSFGPLTKDQLANDDYFATHPKQKNFSGKIAEVEEGYVYLNVDQEKIRIPMVNIAAANLDSFKEENLDLVRQK